MFVEYWEFITRELPSSKEPRAIDTLPDFYYRTILWSMLFTALNFIVPRLISAIYPRWYDALSARDRREFPSYVVCLIHHISMVPTAWVHVYQDSLITSEMAKHIDYASVEAYVGPFCLGYLFGDTFGFAIFEAFRMKFEYIIHHALTIWLIVTAVYGPGNLCRYIPHLLLCDTTNIFFNTAWLLRRSGWRNSSLVTALELLFAISFFAVRVINLPAVFLQAATHPDVLEWGLARFTLLPISCMQWFWFYKIASTILSRILPKRRGDSSLYQKRKSS